MPDITISQGAGSRAAAGDYNEYNNLHPIATLRVKNFNLKKDLSTTLVFILSIVIIFIIGAVGGPNVVPWIGFLLTLIIIYLNQTNSIFKYLYLYQDADYFSFNGAICKYNSNLIKRENHKSNKFTINDEDIVFNTKDDADIFADFVQNNSNHDILEIKKSLLTKSEEQLKEINELMKNQINEFQKNQDNLTEDK